MLEKNQEDLSLEIISKPISSLKNMWNKYTNFYVLCFNSIWKILMGEQNKEVSFLSSAIK